MWVQELVKLLVDRPAVLDALLEEPENPTGVFSCLDAFLSWLWPLTAAPERYCRYCTSPFWHCTLLQAHVDTVPILLHTLRAAYLDPLFMHCWSDLQDQ